MQRLPHELISFYINLMIAILSFYAAWANLVQNKISIIGFDAWLLALGNLFDAEQVRRVRKDPKLIKRMGILMLLFGIGAIYTLVFEYHVLR
jgi:hypothetical protein